MVPSKNIKKNEEERHPMHPLLRIDRIPHIWCPGCGIGTTVSAFIAALEKIIVGKFVDRERPTFIESDNRWIAEAKP